LRIHRRGEQDEECGKKPTHRITPGGNSVWASSLHNLSEL
jgi:hypothetical protein